MIIDTIVLSDFEANCYCVRKTARHKQCMVIDPGLNPEPLIRFLKTNTYKPVAIIVTHGHVDHIGGIESLREYWPQVEVTIHEQDARMLLDPALNLSTMAGTMVQARPAEVTLDNGQKYYNGAELRFRIFHTPGHSPGGICLYAAKEKILFSGDTLFAGSIGRTDFIGGDFEQLIESIKKQVLVLPDETIVYPGHGPQTTIGAEKQYNPFVSQKSGGP